jgi:hypothetical protein
MIEVDEKYRKSETPAAARAATHQSVRINEQARISIEMRACSLPMTANPQAT